MKLEHSVTPCTKINSKWYKDLNIRHDTVKFLDKNTGKTFSDINHTGVFLDQPPKAVQIKVNKWGHSPTYKLSRNKGSKQKRQPTDW